MSYAPSRDLRNSVSAGNGPCASMPRVRAASIAGTMASSSSRPNAPFSPACAYSPERHVVGEQHQAHAIDNHHHGRLAARHLTQDLRLALVRMTGGVHGLL